MFMAHEPTHAAGAGIQSRILTRRGQRVMWDLDLARLFGVSTIRLREPFRRTRGRFQNAEQEQRPDAHGESVGALFEAVRRLPGPTTEDEPRQEIGFHMREEAVPCRIKRIRLPRTRR